MVQSVSKNHGFTDGNKRTSVFLLHLLLDLSGYKLVAKWGEGSIDEVLEKIVMDVVTDRNLSTTLRHRRFLFTDSFLLLWKWRVG